MERYEFWGFQAELDKERTRAYYTDSKEWGEGRCCHELYPHGALGFSTPHFDLEFWVDLAWVLEDDV